MLRFVLLFLCAALPAMAEAPKTYEGRDGDFGALLVLIDPKQLAEFTDENGKHVHLTIVEQAKPKQTVAAAVLFYGMQLDAKKFCDITFDMKLTGPDGKISGGFDQKGLVAKRIDLPAYDPKLVYKSKAVPHIAFDPTDLPGPYTVTAVVYDNIAKKKVTLSQRVQLVK